MKTFSKLLVGSVCFLLVLYFYVDFSKVAKSSEADYIIISEDTTWKKK